MNKIPDELQLLNEWKEILGLKDWYIILNAHCIPSDLELEDAAGEVQYEETTKSAEIHIIDEKYTKACVRPFDFEEVLVHELLHLKLSLLAEGVDWDVSIQLRLLHQIIDDLAKSFVAVKRNNK